jgi:membrane associated rhomboid family serine protease
MASGLDMEYTGDEVAISKWRTNFQKIRIIQNQQPSYHFGLSSKHLDYKNWFTYQFMHGSVLHLLTNMWFLVIIGGALEPILGSLSFLILYLMAGFWGGGAFMAFSSSTAVPLVGASGAISGILGAFCVLHLFKPVRFFFWLLPFRGYSGFVYLPAWISLLMWLISDLAGYFGTVDELGGVAHAAHLGGIIVGICFGGLIFKREDSQAIV